MQSKKRNVEARRLRPSTSLLVVFGLGVPAHAQIQFSEEALYSADSLHARVVDLNLDGAPDVVFFERPNRMRMLVNRGNGEFDFWNSGISVGTDIDHVRIADVNGDDRADVLWVDTRVGFRYLNILWNDGSRSPRISRVPLEVQREPGDVAVGDLDGDGDLDVVVVDSYDQTKTSAGIHIYLTEGRRLRYESTEQMTFWKSDGAVLGDYDLDGDLDLAVLDTDCRYYEGRYGTRFVVNERRVALWNNDGSGAFSHVRDLLIPNTKSQLLPQELTGGDFDGDGDLDLVCVSGNTYDDWEKVNAEIVYLTNVGGDERFQVSAPAAVSSYEIVEGWMRDLDLDGDLDLLIALTRGKELFLVENLGAGVFAEAVGLVEAPFRPDAFDPGDFDGDGRWDIMFSQWQAISVRMNETSFDGPVLEPPAFAPGSPTTLRVTGAQPGETVDFLYTLDAPAPTVGSIGYGPMTLDLASDFFVAGSAVANGAGVAELTIDVPPNAPRRVVTTQAAIRRGPNGEDSVKTPFRMAPIE